MSKIDMKQVITMLFLALLLISIFSAINVRGQASTTLSVNPPALEISIGTDSFFDVFVDSFFDVFYFGLVLTYDTSIIDAVDAEVYPPFSIVNKQINDPMGYMLIEGEGGPVTGTAKLASFEFICTGFGRSDLTIAEYHLCDPTGEPIIVDKILNGYVAQTTWHWKAPYRDYAPSGVPDFDQRQDNWGKLDPSGLIWKWTWCGPTAVANSLWWMDSRFELGATPPPTISDSYPLVQAYGAWDDHAPQNVQPFITNLGWYMDTDGNRTGYPWQGTDVHQMEKGIAMYLRDRGLETTFAIKKMKMPDFFYIEEEVEKCEDVILLLGIWQSNDGRVWWRVGGHYVTVAGVDSQNVQIAFCDPDANNAEAGGMGRVLPPGVVHLHPPRPVAPPQQDTLHNDASLVSQDIYTVTLSSPSPGGTFAIQFYEPVTNPNFMQNIQGQNCPSEFKSQEGPWNPQAALIAIEVEYSVIISPADWYFKPPQKDYAPSGVPDFDEKQWYKGINWTNPWPPINTWSHCGPVAVANSLWWLDSVFEPKPIPPPTVNDGFPLVQSYGIWDDHDPQNVPPFVTDLSWYMDTDGKRTGLPHCGTRASDMQAGIAHYMSTMGVNPLGDCNGDGVVDDTDVDIVRLAYGSVPGDPNWDLRADIYYDNKITILDANLVADHYGESWGKLYEKTVKMPDFYYIEDEIKRCEDVILLLGFWQGYPGTSQWWRVGGHYVTCAGVDSENTMLALSDPFINNAEWGFPGRVIPPPPHPHTGPPETLHNNATYVSHDFYLVGHSPSPGGPFGLYQYPAEDIIDNFDSCQNTPEEFLPYDDRYIPGIPVYTEIEYAVIVSCKTGNVVAGSEDTNVYVWDFFGNLKWQYAVVNPVVSVAMDNNGRFIAAGTRYTGPPAVTGSVWLFDDFLGTPPGNVLWVKTLNVSTSYDGGYAGTESKSVDVKYNAYNGFVVVAAATDQGLYLFDQFGNQIWHYYDGPPYGETIVRISQDGNYIACNDYNSGMVHYFSHLRNGVPGWQAGDGAPVYTTLVDINAFWVAISGDGSYVAVTSAYDQKIYLINNTAASWAGAWVWWYNLPKPGYWRVDMPCHGRSVVAVNDDPTDQSGTELIYWNDGGDGWDAGDSAPVWTYWPGKEIGGGQNPLADFYTVSISENGDYIATGGAPRNTYLLDKTGTVQQVMGLMPGAIQSVDLTFSGKYGASVDNAGTLWFFNKDTGFIWSWTSPSGASFHCVVVSKIYPCMFPYPNHDVDITNVTRYRTPDGKVKTIVCQGYPANEINITLSNHGDFIETVEVRLYAYSSLNNTVVSIGNVTVVINPGTNPVVSMTWNSTNVPYYGNYTLFATISILPDEINVYDNEFTDKDFLITGVGDVTGDRKVDMKDIRPCAKGFGTYPGDLYYYPDYDITCDYKIDMKDVRIPAKLFGTYYP